MRIISQSLMDIPYDQIIVELDDDKIYAIPISSSIGMRLLGKYGTEERAQEVFEQIHKCYKSLTTDSMVFIMPEV